MPHPFPLHTLALALALLCLDSDAASGATSKPVAPQTGTACWYGGKWIGKLTSSGERYRAGDLTAAHRHLPFGTMVRVTNLKNQRSTVVRINNRGPWGKGRIIDLSERAATELAFRSAGTARVRLDVLTGDELVAAKSVTSPGARMAENPNTRSPAIPNRSSR